MASAALLGQSAEAEDVPLISGGVGFFTNTNGGNTSYIPTISPVIAAPIGSRFLIEGRANIIEGFSPRGGGQSGYVGSPFIAVNYLQGDYLVSPHITLVGGEFLIPFATYNERLSPIWVSNFQNSPLSFGLGTGSGQGVGGMLRGSAISTEKYSVDYAAYYSATTTGKSFNSQESSGGRASIYFPESGLEVGASYGRRLVGPQQNFEGFHVWWQPIDSPFRLRSEYAHGEHSQGYWIETDYRLSHFGGPTSVVGRLEPVFRVQQTFRNSPDSTDGLPSVDTQRGDFGLDYFLPHEVRIDTSYSREFRSSGNFNSWETGIVYRFLFPTWKGK